MRYLGVPDGYDVVVYDEVGEEVLCDLYPVHGDLVPHVPVYQLLCIHTVHRPNHKKEHAQNHRNI